MEALPIAVVASKYIIEKIQRWENNLYKHLIEIAGYVTIAALRREIGIYDGV